MSDPSFIHNKDTVHGGDANKFIAFPKIPRLNRNIIISEKIDGTNASVHVSEDGAVVAGKRSGFCTPDHDNFGFAAWVREHESELSRLGPGSHFGEWYGQGIQRGYGLTERRFALFNAKRWGNRESRPACCEVVPVLAQWGQFDSGVIESCLNKLRTEGSVAAPGFMNPEGIVLYHTASGQLYKATLDGDALPKSLAAAS